MYIIVKRVPGNITNFIASPNPNIHSTIEQAVLEATRLARNNIGTSYIIMKAEVEIVTELPPVTVKRL